MSTHSQDSRDTHKATVLRMWKALAAFDFPTLESCLHPEVHYEDIPTDDPGARGPKNVTKRLSIAWNRHAKQEQITHHIAALRYDGGRRCQSAQAARSACSSLAYASGSSTLRCSNE